MSNSTGDDMEASEQYEMEEILPKIERAETIGHGNAEDTHANEDKKVRCFLKYLLMANTQLKLCVVCQIIQTF